MYQPLTACGAQVSCLVFGGPKLVCRRSKGCLVVVEGSMHLRLRGDVWVDSQAT
jgi:hypothetical protein